MKPLTWHRHPSLGEEQPTTHEAWPYVVTRLSRYRSTLVLCDTGEKIGEFETVAIAKAAAEKHREKTQTKEVE